jgi:hypothetical protein
MTGGGMPKPNIDLPMATLPGKPVKPAKNFNTLRPVKPAVDKNQQKFDAVQRRLTGG